VTADGYTLQDSAARRYPALRTSMHLVRHRDANGTYFVRPAYRPEDHRVDRNAMRALESWRKDRYSPEALIELHDGPFAGWTELARFGNDGSEQLSSDLVLDSDALECFLARGAPLDGDEVRVHHATGGARLILQEGPRFASLWLRNAVQHRRSCSPVELAEQVDSIVRRHWSGFILIRRTAQKNPTRLDGPWWGCQTRLESTTLRGTFPRWSRRAHASVCSCSEVQSSSERGHST
jgi:hypothetical protein